MSAEKTKACGEQRRNAKALLKAVREGDAAAIDRAKKHIREFDPSRFSLMTAQHVVAREEGFDSWGDMLRRAGGNAS